MRRTSGDAITVTVREALADQEGDYGNAETLSKTLVQLARDYPASPSAKPPRNRAPYFRPS